MKVLLPREARFRRTPDGAVWIKSSTTYQSWQRYLDVFDSVEVLARIEDVEAVSDDFNRSDGPNVHFTALPYYLGPFDYLRKRKKFSTDMARSLANIHAIILRTPGQVSSTAYSLLETGRPYGVEVVGDPYDVFASGANKHPLRPFLRWILTRDMKRIMRNAAAASYVTETALQARYPTSEGAFSVACSDTDLAPEGFVATAKTFPAALAEPRMVFVGSLEQVYKGLDVLITAMADLHKRGIAASLTVLGDGKYRPELEQQATSLGIDSSIRFVGMVSAGDSVRCYLDQADIFIMPSRTEGLPRAMVESMARALPAIGSRVGGIPELIEDDDLVPVDDPKALADKIVEVVSNPQRMTEMSRRNLDRAKDFRYDVLQARREGMYQHLKSVTESWLNK